MKPAPRLLCGECQTNFPADIRTLRIGTALVNIFKCPSCGAVYPGMAEDDEIRKGVDKANALRRGGDLSGAERQTKRNKAASDALIQRLQPELALHGKVIWKGNQK